MNKQNNYKKGLKALDQHTRYEADVADKTALDIFSKAFVGNVDIEAIRKNPSPFDGVDEDGNLYIKFFNPIGHENS